VNDDIVCGFCSGVPWLSVKGPLVQDVNRRTGIAAKSLRSALGPAPIKNRD